MKQEELKLYVWEPDCHGPRSVVVMAYSEEEAKEAADKFVAELSDTMAYLFEGWGTDKYMLSVHERGSVVTFEND